MTPAERAKLLQKFLDREKFYEDWCKDHPNEPFCDTLLPNVRKIRFLASGVGAAVAFGMPIMTPEEQAMWDAWLIWFDCIGDCLLETNKNWMHGKPNIYFLYAKKLCKKFCPPPVTTITESPLKPLPPVTTPGGGNPPVTPPKPPPVTTPTTPGSEPSSPQPGTPSPGPTGYPPIPGSKGYDPDGPWGPGGAPPTSDPNEPPVVPWPPDSRGKLPPRFPWPWEKPWDPNKPPPTDPEPGDPWLPMGPAERKRLCRRRCCYIHVWAEQMTLEWCIKTKCGEMPKIPLGWPFAFDLLAALAVAMGIDLSELLNEIPSPSHLQWFRFRARIGYKGCRV